MLRSSILFTAAVAGALAGLLSKRRSRVCYFRIRRTKSELGYTFWILQGFDKHKCFVLFDTWQEAIDEANLRLRHPHSSRIAQPVANCEESRPGKRQLSRGLVRAEQHIRHAVSFAAR